MYRVVWATAAGMLEVIEPTADEIEANLKALVAGYNEPTNAVLLGHTARLVERDVREHYASLLGGNGRGFLLLRDGAFVGDADLRGIHSQTGELSFLIANPANQGHGLGTKYSLMIHALAFGPLGMARVYAAVLPDNAPSKRVFAKLGYVVDNTVEGHAYGEPGDIVLVLERADFLRRNGKAVADIRIGVR